MSIYSIFMELVVDKHKKVICATNINSVYNTNICYFIFLILLCVLFSFSLSIKRDALQWLADMSDGDARIALGNLELVVQHVKSTHTKKLIETDDIKDGIKVLKQTNICTSDTSFDYTCRNPTCFTTEREKNITTSFLRCINQFDSAMITLLYIGPLE